VDAHYEELGRNFVLLGLAALCFVMAMAILMGLFGHGSTK
jgi:hypothetical protein